MSVESYPASAGAAYALDAPVAVPAAGTLWVLLPGLVALLQKRKEPKHPPAPGSRAAEGHPSEPGRGWSVTFPVAILCA